MRGRKSGRAVPGKRTWQPPALTKLAIGTETKSGQTAARGARPEPSPPAAPDSKFGFSFEMALPLATRTDL
jgi:hypothetical protein